MAKFYFVKTVFEKNRPRLMPVMGQFFDDGSPIDTAFNVQGDQDFRNDYPMGSIYATEKLTKSQLFYTAGKVFVLFQPGAPDHQKASKEMEDAYNALVGNQKTAPDPKRASRVTLLSKLINDNKFAVPDIMDGFYVPKDDWYFLVRNVLNSINTMLVGPTGTGKTELLIMACKLLDKVCEVFDMGSMLDPISSLVGTHRMDANGSVFDYSRMTEVIQHPGVSILDELSRAPAQTNNVLFPMLDSRRALPCEIAAAHGPRSIKMHVDHSIMATANIGGAYTGTNQLDAALEDRFMLLEVKYMPPDIESQVLTVRTNIEKSEAMIITRVADNIRKAHLNNDLSKSVSTRHTLQVGELIRDGFSPLKALQLVILPKFPEEERPVVNGILSKA